MKLTRRKIILEKDFWIDKRIVQKLELREYKTSVGKIEDRFVLMIYLKTDHEEIELDFLGKTTKNKEKFEECFNYLCNYNGLSSTLNRLLIELDSRPK